MAKTVKSVVLNDNSLITLTLEKKKNISTLQHFVASYLRHKKFNFGLLYNIIFVKN